MGHADTFDVHGDGPIKRGEHSCVAGQGRGTAGNSVGQCYRESGLKEFLKHAQYGKQFLKPFDVWYDNRTLNMTCHRPRRSHAASTTSTSSGSDVAHAKASTQSHSQTHAPLPSAKTSAPTHASTHAPPPSAKATAQSNAPTALPKAKAPTHAPTALPKAKAPTSATHFSPSSGAGLLFSTALPPLFSNRQLQTDLCCDALLLGVRALAKAVERGNERECLGALRAELTQFRSVRMHSLCLDLARILL